LSGLATFALNRGEQRGVDVEIDRVAKLVRFAGGGGFDAGRKIRRVVTSGGAFAETAEQVSQRFVTEKVEAFFGDFEMDVARQRFGDFARARRCALSLVRLLWLLAERQVAFFDETFDELVQQFFEQRTFVLAFVLGEHLLDLAFAYEAFVDQRLSSALRSASSEVSRGRRSRVQ
jgi:hypothetical protein